ncbi:MAG: serine/threonine protein kinase [Deltaproteobacteria bacterium]|nr:serine/threonine protein kinase [Deltaproteobacteria bacterium]
MDDLSTPTLQTVIDQQPLLLKRFTVLSIIGQGAAGAVYRVLDHKSRKGRECALKVLTEPEAFDENTITRFEEELRVCRNVRHPNVIEAYELIKLENALAFTMEYVDGVDLGKILEKFKDNFELIDRVMVQLLAGLHELHLHGIVHRDVKLENVLLRKDGVVKLADLGLMKDLFGKGLTDTGVLLGTAQYLSPEYVTTGKCDARGDVYSAGVLLWELTTGQRRLGKMTGQEVITHLTRSKFKFSDEDLELVPERYRVVVAKAVELKPGRRFQNALEMQEAFGQEYQPVLDVPEVLGESGGVPPLISSGGIPSKLSKKLGSLITVSLVVGFMAFLAGAVISILR